MKVARSEETSAAARQKNPLTEAQKSEKVAAEAERQRKI